MRAVAIKGRCLLIESHREKCRNFGKVVGEKVLSVGKKKVLQMFIKRHTQYRGGAGNAGAKSSRASSRAPRWAPVARTLAHGLWD